MNRFQSNGPPPMKICQNDKREARRAYVSATKIRYHDDMIGTFDQDSIHTIVFNSEPS
jgi:hypothetical protein